MSRIAQIGQTYIHLGDHRLTVGTSNRHTRPATVGLQPPLAFNYRFNIGLAGVELQDCPSDVTLAVIYLLLLHPERYAGVAALKDPACPIPALPQSSMLIIQRAGNVEHLTMADA